MGVEWSVWVACLLWREALVWAEARRHRWHWWARTSVAALLLWLRRLVELGLWRLLWWACIARLLRLQDLRPSRCLWDNESGGLCS